MEASHFSSPGYNSLQLVPLGWLGNLGRLASRAQVERLHLRSANWKHSPRWPLKAGCFITGLPWQRRCDPAACPHPLAAFPKVT